MLNIKFSPAVEALLAKELKKRSQPGVETDYDADILSDEDREDFLREFMSFCKSDSKRAAVIKEYPTDASIVKAYFLSGCLL